MHYQIVREKFVRGFEYEIIDVQKKIDQKFAWIKISSPDQAKRIKEVKISYNHEIFVSYFATKGKMSEEDKKKKNALLFITKNLNRTKTV